jgi:hypothetical protein
MKIKRVVTGGCSFTEGETWARWLREHLSEQHPKVDLSNVAMTSQGQELIQKKVSREVNELLKYFKPEEIAVLIMWSGTERKCFYVNNPYTIANDLKNLWTDDTNPVRDLRNKINRDAAWYVCNWNALLDPQYTTNIAKTHFGLANDSAYAVHLSLENIVFMQNLCKVHGIQYHQMFYMDYALEDIEQYKEHEIVSYLYDQFDQSTIVDKKSIFTYLKELNNDQLYFRPDQHPTAVGQKLWFDKVLLPHLTTKGFFND